MDGLVICKGKTVAVDGVPEEIRLLPLGHVKSQKGDFYVDDESVELICRQFKDRALDLPIDYEHQTLKDMQAPAGGWIKDIYKGADALMAKVRWTDRAAEYLKNREYRYLSPVVLTRKSDKKVVSLHSAALTNTPAIDGMFAIVNSMGLPEDPENNKEDGTMELKKLTKLLGLPEDAGEQEVEKALAALIKAADERRNEQPPVEYVANSVVLSLLGLDKSAKTEDAAAAIMSLKAGSADAELLQLKEELRENAAKELVQEALRAGKITAAQSEWAKSYALSDKEGFRSFVEKAPVIVPQGSLDISDAPDGAAGKEACDPKILKNCGLTDEDVRKYYKEEELV